MSAPDFQAARGIVREFYAALDSANDAEVAAVIAAHTVEDFSWRGMRPFYEQRGATAVAEAFWLPLRDAMSSLHRREDILFAGENCVDDRSTVWVASMGHLAGLFDKDWLGIPASRKLTFLRYAEFHRIESGKIAETATFCDVLSIMHQAGCYPLAPPTGATIIHPGPKTRDGILEGKQPPAESEKTLAIVNQMIADLDAINVSGNDICPPELLQNTWHDDMLWFGPTGIGATYTITRYQEQHQHPFRTQLKDKVFNGHVARFAEGNYAGFFGWPNLTNTPTGGFLGLPGNEVQCDMRVVDIYRREGDKLVENWIFIDLPHWLSMQGHDVFALMREKLNGKR